jgi:uncharacterized delta-60 repeat protein
MLSEKKFLFLGASVALAIAAGTSNAAFAEGPFDPTFAGNGLFPYSYWFGGDEANISGAAFDPLGRLIVATTINSLGKDTFAATRHLASQSELQILPWPPFFTDGLPDAAFGTYGIASDFFATDITSSANKVAVDHQGRVVIGGTADGSATCSDGSKKEVSTDVIVRLRNDKGFDGKPDLTFGSFGAIGYGDCLHATQGISDLAVDKDDSIVAIGAQEADGLDEANVIRWKPSGELDGSFGDGGVASSTFEGNSTINYAIAIDGAGRILTAGEAIEGDGSIVGLLSRYQTDGTLDSTFGSLGYAEFGAIGSNELGYYGFVCCIAIDSKNRAIVAGTIVTDGTEPDTAEQSAFVARFTETGMPDASFGSHGFVHFSTESLTEAYALAVDRQDRPLVAGNLRSAYFPNTATSLSHLNLDGTLNKAVGFDGIYNAAFGYSGAFVTSLLIDQQGRPTLTVNGYDSDTRPVPTLIRYDELFGEGFD